MTIDPSFAERIGDAIQLHANAKQVYGEPVERDGTTVIPVAKIQWGFGGGSVGRGSAERGGGGGGARALPAGFIEIRAGQTEFRPINDPALMIAIAAIGGILAGVVLTRIMGR